MTLKEGDLNCDLRFIAIITGGTYTTCVPMSGYAIGIHYVNITSSVAYPVIEGAAAAAPAINPPGARSAAVCY